MRVMLVGYFLGQGGIQNHLRWLTRMLGEEGIETLAFSTNFGAVSSDDWQYLQQFQSGSVQFICQPVQQNQSQSASLSRLQTTMSMIASIKQFSPDVYLAVGTGWNLFVPPVLAGVKRRIFHEVMSGETDSWRDSRWAVRYSFDEVVGQSPTVARNFAKCFRWKKFLGSLPAIPEPLEITAQLPTVINKAVPMGTAKAALFSRLVPHKQAFWLVQQWDVLEKYLGELHIHGSGPEEPLIRKYIENRGLGDRVKCFGRYPEGQAYVDLLNSYDLTLLPTIGAEGAPLVLLESMACGVPFVAYGVGGIPDYGIDNPNVVIVPLKPDQFITGIQQVIHALASGKIIQNQLQQYYLDRYSYKALKQQWLSYLCHL